MIYSLKLGIRYAMIFMLIAAAMGFIFGIFGGVILQPMLFSIVIVGIVVCMNFVISLIIVPLPMLLGKILKKKTNDIVRYFALSLGFFIVYFPVFVILRLLPFAVF